MELKIGEIFEYYGDYYQCTSYIGCEGCGFYNINCNSNSIRNIRGKCVDRSDSNPVIFKKLEKVREPFLFNGTILQTLKSIDGQTCAYCIFKDKACEFDSCEKGTFLVKFKQTKEEMEEEKLNLKPFNLEAAKAGKPVCTRDGRKARIICFDAKGVKPIIALIDNEGEETITEYLEFGRIWNDNKSDEDLMMLLEKKEGYVNIYTDPKIEGSRYSGGTIFTSEEEAIQGIPKKLLGFYINTTKIEWEE